MKTHERIKERELEEIFRAFGKEVGYYTPYAIRQLIREGYPVYWKLEGDKGAFFTTDPDYAAADGLEPVALDKLFAMYRVDPRLENECDIKAMYGDIELDERQKH